MMMSKWIWLLVFYSFPLLAQDLNCTSMQRVGVNALVHQKPTGFAGVFELANLNANLLTTCQDQDLTQVNVEVQLQQPHRLMTTPSLVLNQLNLAQADNQWNWQLGLLWDPWIYYQHQRFGQHLIHPDAFHLSSRSNTLLNSEMAAQVTHRQDFSEWGARVSNGEPWGQNEQGMYKDVTLWWQYQEPVEWSDWDLLVYFRYGKYDLVNVNSNQKQRWGVSWNYTPILGWRVGLSYLDFINGVDGTQVELTQFGEGFDLSPYGGGVIRGRVIDSWVAYRFLSWPLEAYARTGEWRPQVGANLVGYTRFESGLHWRMNPRLQISLFNAITDFDQGYLSQTQDRIFYGINFEWRSLSGLLKP